MSDEITIIVLYHTQCGYYSHIKVVKRLPVKLPVTGFIFKLPITDLLTYRRLKLHVYSIHTLTQANKGNRRCLDRRGGEEVRTGRHVVVVPRVTITHAALIPPPIRLYIASSYHRPCRACRNTRARTLLTCVNYARQCAASSKGHSLVAASRPAPPAITY